MRKVDTIVLHCSATSNPDVTIEDVRQWHKQRGFKDVGYHVFIRTNGLIEWGRPLEQEGAHVAGHNARSIGICLNGLKEEDFTGEQENALAGLLRILQLLYPQARLVGHNELDSSKECPVFGMTFWKAFWEAELL